LVHKHGTDSTRNWRQGLQNLYEAAASYKQFHNTENLRSKYKPTTARKLAHGSECYKTQQELYSEILKVILPVVLDLRNYSLRPAPAGIQMSAAVRPLQIRRLYRSHAHQIKKLKVSEFMLEAF